MSSNDDFVHVTSRAFRAQASASSSSRHSTVSEDFFKNSKGDRTYTEGFIVSSLKEKYPKHHLTITSGFLDLLAFADSRDDTAYFPRGDSKDMLTERGFVPPARRYGDEAGGTFVDRVVFGCYDYTFRGIPFLVYTVEGSDGSMYKSRFHYILYEDLTKGGDVEPEKKVNELLKEVGKWSQELHGEVMVFDGGFWQKNKELWQNVQKAEWEDVILEEEKKKSIIEDVIGFFNAEERYSEFGVPWKRGVIFYGPPGNGKTISTKALMHDISKRTLPAIESLYVKSFNSYQGPESGIRQIFLMARRMAPCLLIFEDIDSLVNPLVRSYFLNEVDGLESNHGILMIGSTNHLERLDPGISKRPSRFDRKYLFDVPSKGERIQYCEYWKHKLRNNKKIEFPETMCGRVADITGGFSFAYMKEAFVAALLVIVRDGETAHGREESKYRTEDDLSNNILWKELKKQIESLRKEMNGGEDDEDSVRSEAGSRSMMSMSGMLSGLNNVLDDRRSRPIDIAQGRGNIDYRYVGDNPLLDAYHVEYMYGTPRYH